MVCSWPADEAGRGGRKPWAFKTDDIAEPSSAAQTRRVGLHGSCQFGNPCVKGLNFAMRKLRIDQAEIAE